MPEECGGVGRGLERMAELISEPLEPHGGDFDTARMGRGEPGLPGGFTWRGVQVRVARELRTWKESSREGGAGELYLRRHYYELKMDDGTTWTVYFTRQTPKSGSAKRRWFLYTMVPAVGGVDKTEDGGPC